MPFAPNSMPTSDGQKGIQRVGTCPTGYVRKGGFFEALRDDTPRAVPKIKTAA
jgi:hypothetical protein